MKSKLICALLVTATAYSVSGITATGTRTRPGIIAVSRDMRHLVGQNVTVQGKSYKVADIMHRRFRKRIDIYMPRMADAVQFGKQRVIIK